VDNNIIDNWFLTLDEDQPLGICAGNSCGIQIINLDAFIEESKIDMSKEQAGRFADRLQLFVDELREMAAEEAPEVIPGTTAALDGITIRGEG
jgi:hypothetical protein